MPLNVGDEAPDFELKDQNEEGFRLSDFRGKAVLLSFHPLAWTGVCADQMKSLEANRAKFDELDAVAVGVNVDSVFSKRAWAESLGIEHTRLLSDFWPHGEVARKYGFFRERNGFSERANVIVDPDGKVAFVKVYEIGTVPPVDEIIEALANLKGR